MVSGWGYFLVQGVRDPLGGINSLWPLFGIANQMLAAIALCLATTVILKMHLGSNAAQNVPQPPGANPSQMTHRRPALALITLVPLVWLLVATMTAGVEKIAHSDPRIGFLAQANALRDARAALNQKLAAAEASRSPEALAAAKRAIRTNYVLHFNNVLDAGVALVLLLLTAMIVIVSAHQWWLLLTNRKKSELRETDPVWLSPAELSSRDSWRLAGLAPLALALLKELSVEAALERAQQPAVACQCRPAPGEDPAGTAQNRTAPTPQVYVEVTERRFSGVTRCC
jgi:carbon starvation protein